MIKINVWQLEPFDPGKPPANYQQLRDNALNYLIRNPPTIRELDNGLFQVLEGQWLILAAVVNRHYRFIANLQEMSDTDIVINRSWIESMMKCDVDEMDPTAFKEAITTLQRSGLTVIEIAHVMNTSVRRIRKHLYDRDGRQSDPPRFP